MNNNGWKKIFVPDLINDEDKSEQTILGVTPYVFQCFFLQPNGFCF